MNVFNSTDAEEYQKCTAVSSKCKLLAVSSSSEKTGLWVLRLDNLKKKYSKPNYAVQDITFSSDGTILAIATKQALILLDSESGKEKNHIAPPGRTDYGFAKVRFTTSSIVALLNDYPSRKGRKGSYLTMFTLDGTLLNQRQIPKIISASSMDTSEDYTVVGGSDLSLTVVTNKDLKSVMKLNNVHGFAITSISINNSQTRVASTSVANTVHVLDLPEKGSFNNSTQLIWVLLSVTIILALMMIVLFLGLYKMSTDFVNFKVSPHFKKFIESALVADQEIVGQVTDSRRDSIITSVETVITDHFDL